MRRWVRSPRGRGTRLETSTIVVVVASPCGEDPLVIKGGVVLARGERTCWSVRHGRYARSQGEYRSGRSRRSLRIFLYGRSRMNTRPKRAQRPPNTVIVRTVIPE